MPRSSSAPLDAFLLCLRASGLIAPELLETANVRRCVEQGIDALGSHLIARGLLTPWQYQKLRQGKYNGFFLDHYRILGFISASEDFSTFLADDPATGERFALEITPPMIVPLKDGKPRYQARAVFDE